MRVKHFALVFLLLLTGMLGCRTETATIRQAAACTVPGDYPTIQDALDSVRSGDTIYVGPGEYVGNLEFKVSATLKGAGADKTVIRGEINEGYTSGVTVTGFHITAQGAPSAGIGFTSGQGGGEFLFSNNIVEGFGAGCRISSNRGVIHGNVFQGNGIGLELVGPEYDPESTVYNNLVLHNSLAGIRVYNATVPTIMHNTIVGNGFGQSIESGGGGITIGKRNEERVMNNIIVSNHGGINSQEKSNTNNNHNLVWGNVANYVGEALVGWGDVSLDPRFVDALNGNFRLKAESAAIDAGLDWSVVVDLDGIPRPFGAFPDLGAFEFQSAPTAGDLVINEVMANPLDESRGEFIELYNPTSGALEAAGLTLDDGDATDTLVGYNGGATLVPAGGYAVILDRDYGALSPPYNIPGDALLLTVGNSALGSGLSTNDQITLLRNRMIISTYVHPFNPGNGISAERVDSQEQDSPDNWSASPCGSSPGKANCISSGGGAAGRPTLVISEVMANPANHGTEEYIEVYNFGDANVELAGLVISDGDAKDVVIAVAGKSSLLGPGQHGIIIDPQLEPQMTGAPYYLNAEVPVVVTVANLTLGNGLSSTDPVTLLMADEVTVISTFSHPQSTSVQSVERIDPQESDVASNWIPSPCPSKHSAGRPNCAYSGGNVGQLPELLINEVMANPLDEDKGEFVEIYNAGTTPVDLAGLIISDGDATDTIGPFQAGGNTILAAKKYGLILDPEYSGGYSVPGDTVLLAPANSAIGNGLANNDPIKLLASDGVTVISAYSFPINAGNGISVERKGESGDVASNWVASTCSSGSSPGAANCASDQQPPDPPLTASLVISEVMANPLTEATGEFVEIYNAGTAPVDLAGYKLSDGDAVDTIESFGGGATTVPVGGTALILDRGYVVSGGVYTIPGGAVLCTTDDSAIGSGLATDDQVTLLAPDGTTVISTYSHPFNPGNGISVERIDLSGPDQGDNWVASPCTSGSSPGGPNCASGSVQPGVTVVDINTANATELQQVFGISPEIAANIVAYRQGNGNYESLYHLCAIDPVTPAMVDEWRVVAHGEAPYVIGLANEKEIKQYGTVGELLASLPAANAPEASQWQGKLIHIIRATMITAEDSSTKQELILGDWGDTSLFEPTGNPQMPVFLDKAPGAGSYSRDQTDHVNAMADWQKYMGDPFRIPDFYRWHTPLQGYGEIPYASVLMVAGILEVEQGSWRLRIRARADAGVDRMMLLEQWLKASEWKTLEVAWAHNFKPVVLVANSGLYHYLPYRLVTAHPCRQYWYNTYGEWIDVFRANNRRDLDQGAVSWTLFNQALAEWKQMPQNTEGYCFTYDSARYCFSPAEEATGVQILNSATFTQLKNHCYATSLANIVLANRPYTTIAQYDAVSGVGAKSLWNLLVCYVRSGHWPPAAEGTVQSVLQGIPGSEGQIVTVTQAKVKSGSRNGNNCEICDAGTAHCIKVSAAGGLPTNLSTNDTIKVVGRVNWDFTGNFWQLLIGDTGTLVQILQEG